jgi:hypothetical protein
MQATLDLQKREIEVGSSGECAEMQIFSDIFLVLCKG